jgi:hypothetical protein
VHRGSQPVGPRRSGDGGRPPRGRQLGITISPTRTGVEPVGLSCASTSWCVIVGSEGGHSTSLVYDANGSSRPCFWPQAAGAERELGARSPEPGAASGAEREPAGRGPASLVSIALLPT